MGNTYSWQGSSGNFSTKSNWKNYGTASTGYPQSTDTADFGSATTNGAVISGGGTVSALTVEANIDFAASITASAIGNSGTITVSSGGLSSTNSFYNSGTVVIQSGVINSLYFTNAGLVKVAGGSLSNTGFFGDDGSLAVSGTGWLNETGGFAVGDSGNGALTVSAGGQVTTASGVIGNQTGIQGAATVTGTSSTWWNSSDISVGAAGSGTLSILNGGTVDSSNLYAGVNSGASGTIVVNGTHSNLQLGASAIIGEYGNGALTLQAGGLVYLASNGILGWQKGSSGTAVVSDAETTLNVAAALVVGDGGAGTLTIENGATVTGASTTFGYQAGSTGYGVLTGAGSTLSDWQSVFVGQSGSGTLTIGNSASASIGNAMDIGAQAGGNGTITVSTGGRLSSTGALLVGDAGHGNLTILSQGTVNTGVLMIANQTGSSGTLSVSGTGASLTFATGSVGGSWDEAGGQALLAIGLGATVTDQGWTNVWTNGTVALSGGSMSNQSINLLGIIQGYGTVSATSQVQGYEIMNAGSIIANGGVLDVNGGISGSGVMEIMNGSTLELNGSVASTQTIEFTSGTAETLALSDPSLMQAAISGFSSGDTIELMGVSATQLTQTGNAIVALGTGGPDNTIRALASLVLEGSYSLSDFSIVSDGLGDTDLVFSPNGTTSTTTQTSSGEDTSIYLETNRFFAASSPWNTAIASGTASSAIASLSNYYAGLTSWNPTSGSVAIYYATASDPLVAVLYNPGTYSNFIDGTWLRSGNSASVEQQILASSSATNPLPGNPYSTDEVGQSWTSGLPSSYDEWDQQAGQTLYIYVPSGALPPSSTDGQTVIIQPDGTAIELYSPIVLSTGQWVSSMFSATDALNGTGTGADNGRTASMVENYAGVLRDTDVTSGTIDHALAIVVPQSMMTAAIAGPALTFDANTSGYTGTLPMGGHLALPSTLNLASLGLTTTLGMEIAKAAQTYGEYIVDTGGGGISIVTQDNPTSTALNTYNYSLQSDLNIIFHHEVLLAK